MAFYGCVPRGTGVSVNEHGMRRGIVFVSLVPSLHSAMSWGGWI
jgi:hypothetical protein